MRKLLLFGICIVIGFYSYSQTHPRLSTELEKELLTKRKVEVLIVLEQQFDTQAAQTKETKIEKGTYIKQGLIKTAETTQKHLRDFLEKYEIPYRSFYLINSIHAILEQETLYTIADFPEVAQILYNGTLKLQEPVETPSIAEIRAEVEWGIENIRADQVWSEYEITGQGVVISGQDTGYDWEHEALKSKYRGWDESSEEVDHDYNWHDAVDEVHELNSGDNPCGINIEEPCDDHSHGTHTMGTMVGFTENTKIGVAPDARWIGARNMERGWGKLSWYLDCFEWFLAPYKYGEDFKAGESNNAPHIINNSWGCVEQEGCDETNMEKMQEMVDKIEDAGIVVVASNGNEGSLCNTVINPAIFDEVFSVGATNQNNNLASFSSRGPILVDGSGRIKPDVSAPGVAVRSAILGNNYGNKSGTSMAGPHVAGAMALLISANPNLAGRVDSLELILKETARPHWVSEPCGDLLPEDVPNNEFGYGIIDVYEAVTQVLDALPLRLLQFSGTAMPDYNLLEWKTLNEKNFSHFEVQRSMNGLDWETIIKKSGRNDNQAFANAYRTKDLKPYVGKNYYRLRQVDQDGKAAYSHTILINSADKDVDIILYPNPSQGTIYLNSPDKNLLINGEIRLFNLVGEQVIRKRIDTDRINVSLPEGMYFYQVVNRENILLKTGKLILNQGS